MEKNSVRVIFDRGRLKETVSGWEKTGGGWKNTGLARVGKNRVEDGKKQDSAGWEKTGRWKKTG